MLRLIQVDVASTGQAHLCNGTPSFFLNLRARNVLLRQRGHFGFQVVAHQIEFVDIIFSPGWNAASAGGREKISQPCPASTELNPRTSRKNARSASGVLL